MFFLIVRQVILVFRTIFGIKVNVDYFSNIDHRLSYLPKFVGNLFSPRSSGWELLSWGFLTDFVLVLKTLLFAGHEIVLKLLGCLTTLFG